MTLNALRKFLRAAGCIEERVLRVANGDRMFLELVCRTKGGLTCRAVLIADVSGGRLPAVSIAELDERLAACLGRSWTKRVPEEDPFG